MKDYRLDLGGWFVIIKIRANGLWANINMEGIGTVQIKMFDGMIRELKEVRYIPQLKRNFISVGALKILSPEVSIKMEFSR